MSTLLFPALPPVGGFVTQQVLQSIPDIKSYGTKYKPNNNAPQNDSMQGISKHTEIIDTAKYRHSFMHNLCLEMLQEGYHMAFCELFNLINVDLSTSEDQHRNDDDVNIREDEEKLAVLKNLLIAGEQAKRQGRSDEVYEAHLSLAIFFDEKTDYLIADHFYKSSFDTSRHIRGDGRRKEAEANCNLGNAAERKHDFFAAKKLYEEFHILTTDKKWELDDGTLLHNHACYCLQRVYVTLSELLPPESQEEVLEYLHKAYAVAKEGGDMSEMGKVGYLIGNKYDFYGDQETAVQYHTEYLKLCQSINDDAGIGKACQALAYANQRQGNTELAIENLRKFLKMSEKSGDNICRREACSDLGALYKSMGKYEQSSNYYKRAFNFSQTESSLDVIDDSRCEYAVALGHGLLTGEVENICTNKKEDIESLLYWKSERVQGFSTDERTYAMFTTLRNRLLKSIGAVQVMLGTVHNIKQTEDTQARKTEDKETTANE